MDPPFVCCYQYRVSMLLFCYFYWNRGSMLLTFYWSETQIHLQSHHRRCGGMLIEWNGQKRVWKQQ